MDEDILSSKLSVLHEELLSFHKKISPVKNNGGLPFLSTPPEDSKVLSVLLALAKVSVCVTGPTVFPTIVYCLEGSSQLFWQAVAVSSIVVVLLTSMAASVVASSIKKALDSRAARWLREVFAGRNVAEAKVAAPLAVMAAAAVLMVAGAPAREGALAVGSFAAGVLAANVAHLVASPEVLQFRGGGATSPGKLLVRFETPTPPELRKSQDFSNSGRPELARTRADSGSVEHRLSPRVSPGTQSLMSSSNRDIPGTKLLSLLSQGHGAEVLSPNIGEAQLLSSSCRTSPRTQLMSSGNRDGFGSELLSSRNRDSSGKQLLSLLPGVNPKAKVSPWERPETQPLSSSCRISPGTGTQLLSSSSGVFRGTQPMSSSCRISPGTATQLSPSSSGVFRDGTQPMSSSSNIRNSPGTHSLSSSSRDCRKTELLSLVPQTSPVTPLWCPPAWINPGTQESSSLSLNSSGTHLLSLSPLSDAYYYDCVETHSISEFLDDAKTSSPQGAKTGPQFLQQTFNLLKR